MSKVKGKKVLGPKNFKQKGDHLMTPSLMGVFNYGTSSMDKDVVIGIKILRLIEEMHECVFREVDQSKDWFEYASNEDDQEWIKSLSEECSLKMGGTNLYMHSLSEYAKDCIMKHRHLHLSWGHRVPEIPKNLWYCLIQAVRVWNKKCLKKS